MYCSHDYGDSVSSDADELVSERDCRSPRMRPALGRFWGVRLAGQLGQAKSAPMVEMATTISIMSAAGVLACAAWS